MNVALDTIVRRNAAITFTDLDDIVVMMDVDKGRYYELDPVATRIWKLLDTAKPVAEICDVLVEEYDVTPDVCRRDVLDMLHEACERGIIEVGELAARAAAAGA